ncbi:MAG: hypothetical protein GY820_25535 [Gammaproteobacteria bacterium]|nr:hypothetical protein [Gammaproteobacteria bacterium]
MNYFSNNPTQSNRHNIFRCILYANLLPPLRYVGFSKGSFAVGLSTFKLDAGERDAALWTPLNSLPRRCRYITRRSATRRDATLDDAALWTALSQTPLWTDSVNRALTNTKFSSNIFFIFFYFST